VNNCIQFKYPVSLERSHGPFPGYVDLVPWLKI